jgi:hypothetical protein
VGQGSDSATQCKYLNYHCRANSNPPTIMRAKSQLRPRRLYSWMIRSEGRHISCSSAAKKWNYRQNSQFVGDEIFAPRYIQPDCPIPCEPWSNNHSQLVKTMDRLDSVETGTEVFPHRLVNSRVSIRVLPSHRCLIVLQLLPPQSCFLYLTCSVQWVSIKRL